MELLWLKHANITGTPNVNEHSDLHNVFRPCSLCGVNVYVTDLFIDRGNSFIILTTLCKVVLGFYTSFNLNNFLYDIYYFPPSNLENSIS